MQHILETASIASTFLSGPQVLYSDSFRKQVQGKAAFVLDTPEMRRVRETQRIISGVNFISSTFLTHNNEWHVGHWE